MIYGSVCSGIEAATVAWHPLGWRPAFFAEIEAFPSAVLAHHYPEVPNLGDFTRISRGDVQLAAHTIDALVAGTPCQDFSVAGLRAGMDGERGQLTIEFAHLAHWMAARKRARWLVWENVPGVLSIDDGNAFALFLSTLTKRDVRVPEGGWQNSGIVAGTADTFGLAYRVLDAQFFGVPQRRRRVFVVGHLGDWRRAAAVLFERHSLSGHPAPRRETGKDVAPSVAARLGDGGYGHDFDLNGGLAVQEIAGTLGGGSGTRGWAPDTDRMTFVPEAMSCRMAAFGDYVDDGTASTIKQRDYKDATDLVVTHALRGEGFDASEDGTGRGTPLVADTYPCLRAGNQYNNSDPGMEAAMLVPVAFSAKDHGADACEDLSPTLRAGGHTGSHPNAGVMPAVAFALGSHSGCAGGDQTNRSHAKGGPVGSNISEEMAYSLRSGRTQSVASSMAVRRLTPRECERLQGFPDDYTLIPYRGKPAADGPRYKALGNSFAVPVVRWIGERIQAIEDNINGTR